ncbi:MAG TPA: CoA-binding protein [Flavobacteriales bacterium]|nr:CoA-binding protein [Flavobacteriales bacterium]
MATEKKTLVLGASMKEDRYSNKAIRDLRQHGHPVVAVGLREGEVLDVPIVKDIPAGTVVDTVTIYLGEKNQNVWEDRVLALKPKRIIFNPGAENPAFEKKAEAAGIEVLEACTLVMLRTGQF